MTPKIYLVGGAVRDHLLGRESNDRDYVVVGASPEWMIENGYTRIEATNFPVYLDWQGEEYALARQERKTSPGYHGFETTYDSTVTLEDDLLRRDLTINSIAMDMDNNQIIDPYGGAQDLQDKILRHTSEAFADDPVRVLRLARFAARYSDFWIHPDTIQLSIKIVQSGELNTVPKERIWAELFKGLKEPNPAKMLKIMDTVGAMDGPLSSYFPDGNIFIEWADNIFNAMHKSGVDLSVETKYLMCFGGVHSLDEFAATALRIPKNFYQMSKHADVMDTYLMNDDVLDAASALQLIKHTRYDADSVSTEMQAIIDAMNIDHGFTKYQTNFRINLDRLKTASYALKKVDMKAVVDSGDKSTIKQRVEQAKFEAIKLAFGEQS